MSSLPSTATLSGELCLCGKEDCNVTLYKLPDNHGRTGVSQCCNTGCTIDADASHWCVICGANVCGICGIANLSGDHYEPLQRNVICEKHGEYCVKHNILHKVMEIPRAISSDDTDVIDSGDLCGCWEVNKKVEKMTNELKEKLHSCDLGWGQVHTTQGYTNPVKKQRKGASFPTDQTELTRLAGIVIRGEGIVPIALLNQDFLRYFVLKRLNIGSCGNKTKRHICEVVANRHVEYLQAKAAGKEHEFMQDEADPNVRFYINTKRFINVLMGNVMKPFLSHDLFRSLTKQELDEGRRTCQSYGERFIKEYNNRGKYGEDVFTVANFTQDASKFTPIPSASWELVAKKIKDETGDYEKAYNQSKESGYHGDFCDLPVVETNPRIGYLHRMVEESGQADTFRSALFNDLPEDVFSESTTPASARGGGRKGRGGGGGKGRGGGGGKGAKDKSRDEENAALTSIANKNKVQEMKAFVETKGNLNDQLRDAENEVITLMKDFTQHCCDKKVAKERVKAFEARKKDRAPTNPDECSDSSDSSDDDPDESQQTLCKQIVRAKNRKKEIKSELRDLNEIRTPKRAKK
eukprot:CAMPEP_0201717060 /NCGR_PEP_ID=MMETSP0593-20130828/2896_1 /ASSEMBLY_ACC=CAM_ASM_000672 /TAXON_ID=267983 /ORGANISM="Skeletonema japonicum, Strain CCMP2506" /LENGTH=578 /DNA_ID=CAMNT_0048207025 /DNA_START=14 /DNA_END=1750 /DNA_ORIENTATION=+